MGLFSRSLAERGYIVFVCEGLHIDVQRELAWDHKDIFVAPTSWSSIVAELFGS